MYKNKSKGYNVIKKEDNSESTSESDSNDNYVSNSKVNKSKYVNIINSIYTNPSKQAKFTKEDIKDRLNGYKSLKSMEDLNILRELPLYKTWVKYYNIEKKEFRQGGLLKFVDKDLKYIILLNTSKKLTWSVQIKDNIIFVNKEKIEEIKEAKIQELQKKKLYELWKNDRLKVVN